MNRLALIQKMNRRNFLKLMLAAGATVSIPGQVLGTSDSKKTKRPNFIIFLADDLGYGDLACYGNPIVRTPHLDKFAKEGVIFTDCHSSGTVCSPSRASLLTGRNPYRIGFYYILGYDIHLRCEEITIASLLKKQGYDTCFVGKWHLTRIGREQSGQPTPEDHGFDYWFATEHNAFEGPRNPTSFIRNGKKVGEIQGWYCDIIVEEAVQWLKNRPDQNKPFFLLVCSHEPHTPINPPEKYAEIYDNEAVDHLEKNISYGRISRATRDLSRLKKYYYGTITQLDNAFGMLINEIDEMGLRDDTLVFFTSDNGPETPVSFEESEGKWEDPLRDRCFGTPGLLRGMKRYVYEGGHRVPGIARWPGHIIPGSVSDELIDGTDILPTLCELSGAKIPTDRAIDGTSIVPVFKGRSIRRKKSLCWMFPAGYSKVPNIAMRDGDYVLISWFNQKREDELWMNYIKTASLEKFELYNLRADIAQIENTAEKEPQRLKLMADKMRKLWREIQAEAPVWKEWIKK